MRHRGQACRWRFFRGSMAEPDPRKNTTATPLAERIFFKIEKEQSRPVRFALINLLNIAFNIYFAMFFLSILLTH